MAFTVLAFRVLGYEEKYGEASSKVLTTPAIEIECLGHM